MARRKCMRETAPIVHRPGLRLAVQDLWRRLALAAVCVPLLVSLGGRCWAQKSSCWRVYKAVDGMPEAACVAVYFSAQGKVLARHLNLPYLSELDGYRVVALAASPNSKGKVYQSPGGQLWAVTRNGLEEFRGGTWLLHPVPDVANSVQTSILDPVPLYPVRQDLVLLLFPDKLVEFNAENPQGETRMLRLAAQTGLGRFSGMTAARKGGLWISGYKGVARVPGPLRNLKAGTPWTEFLLPDNLGVQNLQEALEEGGPETQSEGSTVLTMLGESRTNRNKVIVTLDNRQWSASKPQELKLRHAWRGPDHTCWAMTIDTLWQWQPSSPEMTECDEVGARQYFDVAVEPGGAFWMATSDGLYRYAPLLWRSPPSLRSLDTPVRCLTGNEQRRVWFTAGTRLYELADDKLQDFPLPQFGNRLPQPRGLYRLKSGALVLALEEPGLPDQDLLFSFQTDRGVFAPIEAGPGSIRILGFLRDGTLGVERARKLPESQQTGTHPSAPAADTAALGNRRTSGTITNSLEAFDGAAFVPVPEAPPARLGRLRCLLFSQTGDLWVGGDSGTACLRNGKWREYIASDRSMPQGASCFAELLDGRIWCAVEDQIWEFDGHTWSVARQAPDRINQLQRGKDGSIWVATNNGLLRFFRGAWVENGPEDGLPSTTVRDLFLNERGLWAATSRGLSLFHPEADPETDAPRTYIQRLTGPRNSAPEGSTVFITFSGRDKWKYTARERLLYSYRLDDRDWSPYQDINRLAFADLAPGKHYFQVRAMDRNCNVDPNPAQLEFVIILPWYKEARLLAIACAGAAAALFFGALAVNRHLRLLRSHAEIERKVAERTRQLELASQELHRSQKMTALGTLAAGVAHDFNNILSIIKGSAQIIEDNIENPHKIRIRTDRIRTVVEQGAGIVKAMLGFSRESSATEMRHDINSIVQETLRLLGDRFLREVKVEFRPGAGLPEVPVVKEFVQQIVLNFIFNAAEAMSDRKTIKVTTTLVSQLPPAPILKPASGESFVAISVQDTGSGIAPDNLERIFEPFFTTKALSTRRGTGLGLSMAYELAKRLGAGLVVDSILGKGSTFTLLLAVREIQPPGAAERNADQPQP